MKLIYKILILEIVVFGLYLACNEPMNAPAPTTETETRMFTGPTAQYSNASQELLVLEKKGNILVGKSYTSFSVEEPFIDPEQAADERNFTGVFNGNKYTFKIKYNENEYAEFEGFWSADPIMKAKVKGKYKPDIGGGKGLVPFEENYQYDEIINGKITPNPRYINDVYVNKNKRSMFKLQQAYPQMIQYPDKMVKFSFNASVKKAVAGNFTNMLEFYSGDGEAISMDWMKARSDQYKVMRKDKKYYSLLDTIFVEIPDIAELKAHIFTFTYDFENEKQVYLENIFKENVDIPKVLSKIILEENEELLGFTPYQEEDLTKDLVPYQYWALSQNHIHFFLMHQGELSGYAIAKTGLPEVVVPLEDLKEYLR